MLGVPIQLISSTVTTNTKSRPSSTWIAWGQWLALITMTVDHVVRFLIPECWDVGWASSSIGRIAFPLFAAMVAWHGLFNTRDPICYAQRILIIGLVAQLPYLAMPRDDLQLNICFTLALGLCWGTWLRDMDRYCDSNSFKKLLVFIGSLVVWYYIGPWVEYGHNGLLMIPFYMLALQKLNRRTDTLVERFISVIATLPVLINAGLLNSTNMAKFFTIITCLFVLLMAVGVANRVPHIGFRMPRLIWLVWYPTQLAVIAVLLHLLGSG